MDPRAQKVLRPDVRISVLDEGRRTSDLEPARDPEGAQLTVQVDRPQGIALQVRLHAGRKSVGARAEVMEPALPRRPRREAAQGP